ncbi:carboxypeptidase-like regulatory domain-containing protein [Rufibacter hautae]|uniref:Carboxypeptidase-like regulatory domain-containing protein n=1 Tax=Rufibacter hautae TaxID=2595005 RepID=A0A5B6TI03_9BACT|nr:carboxypeptidase-like regulatory domain-containing protein [Rufibacter hautae]KAA3440304.1 carboxypeptidase-like regulatory domain-containing protein [Rufibacter hautae]
MRIFLRYVFAMFSSASRTPHLLCFFMLLLLWCGPGRPAQGQAGNSASVAGTVVDAQTKKPLGFATVFIAQTTYGTNSAENGTFKLSSLPAGTHELVVSFLGYETLSHKFTLQAGQQLSFRFELMPKANALQEIVIRPDTNWKQNYSIFLKNFIGQTENAAKTEIINADVLYFQFDPEARLLTAEAIKPLIIENRALGYRLHFVLEDFQVNFANSQTFHAGYPRFEKMKPRSNAQQKRWEEARLNAYNGSLMHFTRALYRKNLEAEGFNVRRLERRPNPNRPPEAEIQAGLNRARNQQMGTIMRISQGGAQEDSLSYWSRMAGLDKTVAFLYKDPIPYEQLVAPDASGERLRLQFKDNLNVVYTKEKEELGFVNQRVFSKRRASGFQTSLLTLTEPYTFIEPNGMILNPYSHLVEGYWAWEKLAEMLPLDYSPRPE